MGQPTPLSYRKCSIVSTGNFNEFYVQNFETFSKCLWGPDASITGEDLAQEVMLYMWKNYWKGNSDVVLEPKGFYSASNLVAWSRMIMSRFIFVSARSKSRKSKYSLVSMDNTITKETGLTGDDANAMGSSTSMASDASTVGVLERIYEEITRNFSDRTIQYILMGQVLGLSAKEMWHICGVTKVWFYRNYTQFDAEVFDQIKTNLLTEFADA